MTSGRPSSLGKGPSVGVFPNTWTPTVNGHLAGEVALPPFNEGDYLNAVEQKIQSETVSKVLYPSDAVDSCRYLRLKITE
jgi:Carbohydrate phosphorylase